MASGWTMGLALCGLAGAAHARTQASDAAAGRVELQALVAEILAAQKDPKAVPLRGPEQAIGLPFHAVELNAVRVLATSGEEEARRVAQVMGGARELFTRLTGVPSSYPGGVSAYLLGSPEAKTIFLAKHPRLGPETRERLAKLEGAGIPGTADWAWWEGDSEKRLDGMVRFAFDWLFRAQGVTTERHAWLHEGLGFYLTHALVGTRLSWFVRPRIGDAKRSPDSVALAAQLEEPGADWLALAHGLFAPEQKFDLEEVLHLEPSEFEPRDYLRAHALCAYLVEVRPAAVGAVLTRIGQDEDPRGVLQDALGLPFDELRGRLDGWLAERDQLLARAEGRRPDAELRAQWEELDGARRRLFVQAFQRRVDALDTTQLRWLRALTAGAGGFAGPADPPFFDPKQHAPAQPIARKRLSDGDGRVKRLLKELGGQPDAHALALAYDYDWARARVFRSGKPDDPELVFENALRGAPPGADLARALVLKALDHPLERKLQASFSHAYSDRDGNVFPVSLYEMWATGTTIEMPDVDTLGIVHEVLDEWKRWVAPVPAAQHDGLYKVLGELYQACRRSRELRLTLADLYLAPGAPPRTGYESLQLNLQALWAVAGSDPQQLAPLLPDGKGWESYLAELVARCQRDYKVYAQGRRRAAQLRADGLALRIALGAALDEAATAVLDEPGAGDRADPARDR